MGAGAWQPDLIHATAIPLLNKTRRKCGGNYLPLLKAPLAFLEAGLNVLNPTPTLLANGFQGLRGLTQPPDLLHRPPQAAGFTARPVAPGPRPLCPTGTRASLGCCSRRWPLEWCGCWAPARTWRRRRVWTPLVLQRGGRVLLVLLPRGSLLSFFWQYLCHSAGEDSIVPRQKKRTYMNRCRLTLGASACLDLSGLSRSDPSAGL